MKTLRDVFGKRKPDERRPKTNHIMERYSKKSNIQAQLNSVTNQMTST